jgi:hypothetical protein
MVNSERGLKDGEIRETRQRGSVAAITGPMEESGTGAGAAGRSRKVRGHEQQAGCRKRI